MSQWTKNCEMNLNEIKSYKLHEKQKDSLPITLNEVIFQQYKPIIHGCEIEMGRTKL